MLVEVLIPVFERDLNKLKIEIDSYKVEANIWLVKESIANSAGNLCLHLVGNLNAFIGAAIGGTDYIRTRNLEFSQKDIPRPALIHKIDETIEVIRYSLVNITDEQMTAEYPLQVFQQKTSTGFMLVHLSTHLAYHLGQVNYHRRLLEQ